MAHSARCAHALGRKDRRLPGTFIVNRVTEILTVALFTHVVNYTDPTIAAL